MDEYLLKIAIKNAVKEALSDQDKNKILSAKQKLNATIPTIESMIKDAKIDDENLRKMTNIEAQRYKLKLDKFKFDSLKRGIRNFLQELSNDKLITFVAAKRLLDLYNSGGITSLGDSDAPVLQAMITALKEVDILLDKKLR